MSAGGCLYATERVSLYTDADATLRLRVANYQWPRAALDANQLIEASSTKEGVVVAHRSDIGRSSMLG